MVIVLPLPPGHLSIRWRCFSCTCCRYTGWWCEEPGPSMNHVGVDYELTSDVPINSLLDCHTQTPSSATDSWHVTGLWNSIISCISAKFLYRNTTCHKDLNLRSGSMYERTERWWEWAPNKDRALAQLALMGASLALEASRPKGCDDQPCRRLVRRHIRKAKGETITRQCLGAVPVPDPTQWFGDARVREQA